MVKKGWNNVSDGAVVKSMEIEIPEKN